MIFMIFIPSIQINKHKCDSNSFGKHFHILESSFITILTPLYNNRRKLTSCIRGAGGNHSLFDGCTVSEAAHDIRKLQRGHISICRTYFHTITQIWLTFFVIITSLFSGCIITSWTVYDISVFRDTNSSSVSFKISPC